MADLDITPALVVARRPSRGASGLAGGGLNAGLALYRDGPLGRWRAASAVAEQSRGRAPGGLGLNEAFDGQPVAIHRRGLIDLGEALLTPGAVYYLSATQGRLCRLEDLDAGAAIVAVGLAYSDRVLGVSIHVLSLGEGAVDVPPVNTVLPSILGGSEPPRVGETLSVDLGEWDNAPYAYAVRWRLDGVAINGEFDDEYLVDDADEGGIITVTVTATNSAGSTPATSLGAGPVAPAPEEPGEGSQFDFSDPDNSGWLGAL